MELREFVQSALVDIMGGIRGANEALQKEHGWGDQTFGMKVPFREAANQSNVEFDVAVTITDATEGQGKAGINVLGLRAGVGGKLASQQEEVSRIRFSVVVREWVG